MLFEEKVKDMNLSAAKAVTGRLNPLCLVWTLTIASFPASTQISKKKKKKLSKVNLTAHNFLD